MPAKDSTKNKQPDPELRQQSIDTLRYDSTNPRIVEMLGPKASQQDIQRLLLSDEVRARALIPSFIENGYIPYEPLIVRSDDGKDVVIEGNRRLAALRAMRDSDVPEERKAFETHNLQLATCITFVGEGDELLAYLGLRHLSKTRDWSTSAKGAFVERVLQAGNSLEEAASKTNTTTNALRLILLARRLFEEAGNLGFDLPSSTSHRETLFWHLGDAVRRTRTKAYLKLQENPDPLEPPEYDQSRLENLVTWLYGNPKTGQSRLIGSIRDIGKLDTCLGDGRAIQALEEGASLDEAEEELHTGGASVASHLGRAARSVQRATTGVSTIDKAGLETVREAEVSLTDARDVFQAAFTSRTKQLNDS